MKNFIILSLFIVSFLQANTKVIDIKDSQHFIGEKITYYEDSSSKLKFNDIQNLDYFEPLNKKIDSHTFTSSSYWYKFRIFNPTNKVLERYFVFDIPWLDEIEIFIIDKNSKLFIYKLGNTLEFQQRSIKNHFLNIKHDFSLGNSQVFIKVKTRDPFIVPISILDKTTFLEKINDESSFISFIYGIVICMIIFNLFLYFVIKEKVYLYYILYLCSFMIMNLSYNGYIFQKLLYSYPEIQNWVNSITIFIFAISGLLFARVFLELKNKLPFLDKLTLYIISGIIFLGFSTIFLGYHYHVALSILIILLSSLYILFIGILSHLKGNQNAIFFILGTSAGFFGASLTALTVISLIPFSDNTFKAVEYGMAIDTILLSIALANRYKNLYINLQSTQKELDLINENLTLTVEQRTNELSVELKNKDILLKEIFHRVKNNLQIISSLLSLQIKKIKNPKDQDIFRENIKRIKALSILHEILFISNNFELVDLKEYINNLIKSIDSSLKKDNITIDLNCKNIQLESKYAIPLGLVINELITNTLKYAFIEDKDLKNITINIMNNEELEIEFYDNGIGADLDKIKKGFGFQLLDALITYQLKGVFKYSNENGLKYIIKLNKEYLS